MKENSIALTSITYAIRAQNALRAQGVRSVIARDERYLSGNGCGYSLNLQAGTDMNRVRGIMQEARIKIAPVEGRWQQ